MCFPFEQVTWVQSVGTKFEDAAELAGSGGGPERELLHEGGAFGGYELFKFVVKFGKVGVRGDGVERVVVAVIALIFPDVYCCHMLAYMYVVESLIATWKITKHTKSITVSNLSPPTAHKMHFIVLHTRHLWVPLAHQLDILIHLVWLDFMKHNRVDVFSTRQHLREGGFNLLFHLASFLGAIE